MARIWQNGFEIPHLPEGSLIPSGTTQYDGYNITVSNQAETYKPTASYIKDRANRGYALEGILTKASYTSSFFVTCYTVPCSEMYFRGYFKINNLINTYYSPFITLNSNSTTIGSFFIKVKDDNNYYLSYHRGSLNSSNQRLELIIPKDKLFLLEFHIIATTATSGLIEIKLDGVIIGSYSGSTTDTGQINNMGIGICDRIASFSITMDDIAINDTTGTVNNSWIGAGTIYLLKPTSNGSLTQFVPSTGTNFENIDENIADGDTSYNSGSNVGDTDLFNFADLPTLPNEINSACLSINGRYTGLYTNIKTVSKNGTTVENTTIPLTGAYTTYFQDVSVNPSTGVKYKNSTELNSSEFGYKIV